MSKRERIVEAAIDIFSKNSIEKAKISDITKAAGIAQGTFYLYFPSKLALMPSIAERTVLKLLNSIKANTNPELSFKKQLSQIIDITFSFVKEYKVIYAFIYTGLSQTEHLKEWETIYSPFYAWMSEFLDKYKSSKKIKSPLPAQTLAKMVITVIEATAEQTYLYDTKNESTVEKQKEELLIFLQNALATKK